MRAVPARPRLQKRLLRRLLLVSASLGVGLLLAEGVLRLCLPRELFVQGKDTEGWTENTPTFDAFMSVDAAIGYVPKPDTVLYDARGLCRDQPADQALPTGPSTVLWIGDSVTARRFVEREVRQQAAVSFASWCGGVEGYNAAQTAAYFARTLQPLGAQRVVFTLHHNDWWNTPVVFYDDDGRVHCRTTEHEVAAFSPWLFRHSYLYRFAFQVWHGIAARYDERTADAKVERALVELRDRCAAAGVPFAVLLLPPMLAEARWQDADRARHARALALLDRLGIHHVDLLPALRRGLAAGVDPQQAPGDWMHPSPAIARYLAEDVVAADVLPAK